MIRPFFMLVVALVLMSPLSAYAINDEFELQCPTDLKADQSVSRLPHGWMLSTLTADIPKVDGLTLFDGPPGQMTTIPPKNETLKKEDEKHFWKFKSIKSNPIWVQCFYKEKTLRLMRPLPDKVKECTLALPTLLVCKT